MGSHKLHRLTALSVKKINTPGKYGDGHGLYLIVDSSGAKRWEQRLTVQGRRRDIGLGSLSLVSLEEAREIALKNKRLARDGGDPIAEKRVAEGQNISFKDVAMSVHQLNAPSYRNAKYAAQWLSSLENHAFEGLLPQLISYLCYRLSGLRRMIRQRKYARGSHR